MEKKCIKVKKTYAEESRLSLIERSLLDMSYRPFSRDDHVYFPLINGIDTDGIPYEITTQDFQIQYDHPRSYKELIDLPHDIMVDLPSSFDVIGDVCILKLPENLIRFSSEIASALLKTNRNFRSIALDRGVKGEFRIRDLEVIGGDKDLETLHIENNIRLKLDPSKVYFSPRLATERARVAAMVKNERVLDMFSGVGPFSINCARGGDAKEIVGIDLNPDCIEFFITNIGLNSCQDRVEAYLGDSREAIHGMDTFDRIIMNLPHGAVDFLDAALSVMDIGVIHLYSIVDDEKIMDTVSKIDDVFYSLERSFSIIGMREIHNYSATQTMMVFDLNIPTIDS